MARPLRLEFEGALYHLSARGNRRQMIFVDDGDCQRFLDILAARLERFDVALHGFVLMKNHFHLLAETRRANLSRWMHWLLVTYSVYFQRRHECVGEGHLFQGRFKSILVEAEGYLLTLSRYLHLNPVRGAKLGRGELAERRQRLRAWRWSSYESYAGLAPAYCFVSQERVAWADESLLAGAFVPDRVPPGLSALCRRGPHRGGGEPKLQMVQAQAILGSEHFVRAIKDRLAECKEALQSRNEMTAVRRLKGRNDLARASISPGKVIGCVAARYEMPAQELTAAKRKGGWSEARGVAMVLVWQLCELNYRQVGELFQGAAYAAVAQRIRRIQERDRAKKLRFSLHGLAEHCRTSSQRR